VAAQFEKCLARLPDIEDADDGGVGGEGSEEVRVVWRGGEAEERGCIRHCLLSFGGGHAAW
jgi:hypothetical protein